MKINSRNGGDGGSDAGASSGAYGAGLSYTHRPVRHSARPWRAVHRLAGVAHRPVEAARTQREVAHKPERHDVVIQQ